MVADAGGANVLVQLLVSSGSNKGLQAEAAGTLQNLAASPICHGDMAAAGAVPGLLSCLRSINTSSSIRSTQRSSRSSSRVADADAEQMLQQQLQLQLRAVTALACRAHGSYASSLEVLQAGCAHPV